VLRTVGLPRDLHRNVQQSNGFDHVVACAIADAKERRCEAVSEMVGRIGFDSKITRGPFVDVA